MGERPHHEGLCQEPPLHSPTGIKTLRKCAEPYLSAGNQCGEGWFLAGEMVELVKSGGAQHCLCTAFGCLPNHIVGKGVMRSIQRDYPEANMIAVDYDPGASEVNQLNRIKTDAYRRCPGSAPGGDGRRRPDFRRFLLLGELFRLQRLLRCTVRSTVAVGIGYRER